MDHRHVIVVGASAGGVEALREFVAHLPSDLNAAVLIVLHIPVHTPSTLPGILEGAGPLPVRHATDNSPINCGTIYVAPTDRHLVIENGCMRLTRGPRENRVRPCIDVLFRSAALEFGPRVIGVVLSGALDDGTAGLWAIKDRGGIAIVQDPSLSQWPSMPASAMAHTKVDYVLPVSAMGDALLRLTSEKITLPANNSTQDTMSFETRIAISGNALQEGVMDMGEISPNTCPECHGVLVRIREGTVVRFRCHTGHAFSLQTLLADVDDAIDDSLWNAIRAIEERSLVLREMAAIAANDRRASDAENLQQLATEAEQRAQRIRDLVVAAVATTGQNPE